MISVVIPLFNKARTIVNTIKTVFAQTYTNYEIVIVDDGSTDDSVQIIENNFRDSKLRIIRQVNCGVSVARNRGVDESKGEYVAFLDGDDEWHPDYLNVMSRLIGKYPDAGLFLCGGLITYKSAIYYRVAKGYEGYRGRINLFHNPEVFSHTSATIVRKDLFNKTHRFIPNMCKYEDFLASQSLALSADVVYCGEPLTKYVGGVEGQLTLVNRNSSDAKKSMLMYYNGIVMDSFFVKKKVDSDLKIYLRYNIRHNVKLLLLSGRFNEVEYLLNGLSKDVKGLFFDVEWKLFLSKWKIAVVWINLTKILWRLHRYPIVLQTPDLDKCNPSFLNW